eukprot:15431383-Alexandrium_andersonii.AAC.1
MAAPKKREPLGLAPPGSCPEAAVAPDRKVPVPGLLLAGLRESLQDLMPNFGQESREYVVQR